MSRPAGCSHKKELAGKLCGAAHLTLCLICSHRQVDCLGLPVCRVPRWSHYSHTAADVVPTFSRFLAPKTLWSAGWNVILVHSGTQGKKGVSQTLYPYVPALGTQRSKAAAEIAGRFPWSNVPSTGDRDAHRFQSRTMTMNLALC